MGDNTRQRMLDSASSLINGDREQDYGSPKENFGNIAQRWSQVLGIDVKPWQVCLMMADVKIARMCTTRKVHMDSLIDLIGYGALAGEVAEEDGEET